MNILHVKAVVFEYIFTFLIRKIERDYLCLLDSLVWADVMHRAMNISTFPLDLKKNMCKSFEA